MHEFIVCDFLNIMKQDGESRIFFSYLSLLSHYIFLFVYFLPSFYFLWFLYLSSWIAPVPSHTRRARKMATGGGHIGMRVHSKLSRLYILYTFSNIFLPTVHMKVFQTKKLICGNARHKDTSAKLLVALVWVHLIA